MVEVKGCSHTLRLQVIHQRKPAKTAVIPVHERGAALTLAQGRRLKDFRSDSTSAASMTTVASPIIKFDRALACTDFPAT